MESRDLRLSLVRNPKQSTPPKSLTWVWRASWVTARVETGGVVTTAEVDPVLHIALPPVDEADSATDLRLWWTMPMTSSYLSAKLTSEIVQSCLSRTTEQKLSIVGTSEADAGPVTLHVRVMDSGELMSDSRSDLITVTVDPAPKAVGTIGNIGLKEGASTVPNDGADD